MYKTVGTFKKGFWQLADPKIWVASTLPMFLGVILSSAFGKGFDLFWMVFSFIGVYSIEIGKNAINECVDYISGADPGVDGEHRTPFSGGKKTIIDGILTFWQAAFISISTMTAAAFIGVIIALFREPKVFSLGIIGFLLAIIYSLPPFKLSYRGFGELAVGITFGPLVLNGMYVVMSHQYDVLPFLVSIPIGFLIANVLMINQFPDYEADKAAGKNNWVVRLGKEYGVKIYLFLFILAYLSIVMVGLYTSSPVWLIALATVPMAVKSVNNCRANLNNMSGLIKSNAATVQIYILTGALLGIAALMDAFLI